MAIVQLKDKPLLMFIDIPVANQPNDVIICDDDNDGIWSFNFHLQNPDVLGSLKIRYRISVHYYESLLMLKTIKMK